MSKPEPDFEMDDLIQELLATETEGRTGWRVAELAAATGMSTRIIRERLRRLKAEGRLVLVRSKMEDLSGRMMPVPAYRLKTDGA